MVREALMRDGFVVLPEDARVRIWAKAAHEAAVKVTSDPAEQAKWLRHGNTWFVGVDALPTGADGSIGGVALAGPWEGVVPKVEPLHPAQLSVVYPGYPKRDADEPESAHKFRKTRDAAHLDGLLAEGPQKRRHLREAHAWILGIPLNSAKASPLVVYAGSHEVVREGFLSAFAGLPPSGWGDVDVTAIYKDIRDEVFETCERVEVPLSLGQSVLVHRLAIHGVAAWRDGDTAPKEGRMIAYFRPVFDSVRDWLRAD